MQTHPSERNSLDTQGAESGSGPGKQRRTLSISKKSAASKGNGQADNEHHGPPAVDKDRSTDERQAEKESTADTVSKPGGYDNDPDDPTNPNEVREKTLRRLRR